jgi:hypothetical protein
MRESAVCFHNLEWPPDGARLAGPVAWLRGWIVGRPGHDFVDLRVRHAGGTHLGVLGLPRTDLATHFQAARPWLPAEFILGVPVADGPVALALEAMDAHGQWHLLQTVSLTIGADGQPPPRVEGRVESRPDGSWTVRDAHHPFHGHLDAPGATPVLRDGRAPVFGWLLDEMRPLAAVLATTDTLVFNHLEHSRTDDALAAKVSHPGARHARLRGAVDFPATLPVPACLRVYAVSPDGSVTLCFAQRLQPPATTATVLPATTLPVAPAHQPLPALPSGRPRRLLFVLRTLFPDDATLRALDLARHLTAAHRWAVRVVATEDGPLRRDFEAAGVESLVVDPGPMLSAASTEAMTGALRSLERQIRWDYLDAVVVFDPVCGWAMAVARRRGLRVLFDCSAAEPVAPDATALPDVQALQREGWLAASFVCFASATAARAQHALLGGRPAALVGAWHTPGLAPLAAEPDRRIILAPLRTVDWLARQHPATAARWFFRQGPAVNFDAERLAQQDDAFNVPALQHAADWGTDGVALCLGPLFGRGPLRPVIDAVAAGIPAVAPDSGLTRELFAGTRVPCVDAANPLAAAHALLAWESLPATLQREAAAIAPDFRAAHDPAHLLPQWERLLETSIAAHTSAKG